MRYHVAILSRARGDIERILDWLGERSPDGANRWLVALEGAKASLAKNPLTYGLALESRHVGIQLRERFFKTHRGRTYRLLFTIVEREVRILRVRGPGQPPVTSCEVSEREG
jgi:plasmid stabilization system protein ParE